MNIAELENTIREVLREEQDYQRLFKTMLDKSGKDIASMSDTDKKKFFNAVDKAYKAKSEGRLAGYDNKSEINEDWSEIFTNPFFILLLSKFVFQFVGVTIYKGLKFIFRKEYREAISNILNTLQSDDAFIKKATQILSVSKKMDKATADKIANLPIVMQLCIKEVEKMPKGGGGLTKNELHDDFRDLLVKAWNDSSIKNAIIDKLKNDIK
jgi:hypothetical protein